MFVVVKIILVAFGMLASFSFAQPVLAETGPMEEPLPELQQFRNLVALANITKGERQSLPWFEKIDLRIEERVSPRGARVMSAEETATLLIQAVTEPMAQAILDAVPRLRAEARAELDRLFAQERQLRVRVGGAGRGQGYEEGIVDQTLAVYLKKPCADGYLCIKLVTRVIEWEE